MYEHILVEVEDGVGLITLNRPEKLNAMNRKLSQELHQQIGDRPSHVGARVEPKMRRRGVVAPFDAVLGVEDHHAVGQRLRGMAKARQRLGEPLDAARAFALVPVQAGEHLFPAAQAFGQRFGQRLFEPACEPGEHMDVGEGPRAEERQGGPPAPRPSQRNGRQAGSPGDGEEDCEGAKIDAGHRVPFSYPGLRRT